MSMTERGDDTQATRDRIAQWLLQQMLASDQGPPIQTTGTDAGLEGPGTPGASDPAGPAAQPEGQTSNPPGGQPSPGGNQPVSFGDPLASPSVDPFTDT